MYENSSKSIGQVLLEQRVINISGQITTEMAYEVCAAALVLGNKSKDPIYIFINSPGGSVEDGLAMYDTLKYTGCKIITIVCGMAASMAAFMLSCAGDKGCRFAMKHSRIMFHRVASGAEGKIQDLMVTIKEANLLDDQLATMISERCGIDKKKYLKIVDRDKYMSAEEALDFGAIDKVITTVNDIKL